MGSLPPGTPVVLPEAPSGAPPLHPAAFSASLVPVGGVVHARSPSAILHHDAVRGHILSLYLTLDLGRDSTLSNPRSPFSSGRFRPLVLGPTHCFRLMIQPFVVARRYPNLAACPVERAPNKCGQYPAGGPRYRVARLSPQRGLAVAPLGEQGTASDPLAVHKNFDGAEFLVGLGRYGSFSNPYP